jgi:hypothetical protein
MIYEIICENGFVDAFRDSSCKENFSHEALCALYDYYENWGDDIELDVIAIACDWNELSIDEIISEYDFEADITAEELLDYLNDRAYAIKLSDSIVFQVF